MKFNSLTLLSLLASCALGRATNKDATVRANTNILIEPSPSPTEECPLGKGVVISQELQCNKRDGRFFREFHPYPDCYSDYACFIPQESGQSKKDCIKIDKVVYCSAEISNKCACQPECKSYNFEKCVKLASELFEDFHYTSVSGTDNKTKVTINSKTKTIKPSKTKISVIPTIINPSKTKIPLNRTNIKPINTKITLNRTIIKPINTKITLNPTMIKPIKTKISLKPIVIKTSKTKINTRTKTIINPTKSSIIIVRPTVAPVPMKEKVKNM